MLSQREDMQDPNAIPFQMERRVHAARQSGVLRRRRIFLLHKTRSESYEKILTNSNERLERTTK